MSNIFEWSLQDWIDAILAILKYLLKRWYLFVIALIIGAGIGYYLKKDIKPTYTATISFVLSTENTRMGGGLAGLASQLGFDTGTSGGDNVFSGDNIIELFKSKKMVRKALLSEADTLTHQSLLNLIAYKLYPKFKKNLPFPATAEKFNLKQQQMFKSITGRVASSFTIFKKDKKLIFYYISATSLDQEIAFYTAKAMLAETSRFFIETKTSAANKGLNLLKKEADSLGTVLGGTFRSTAAMADKTYNINPSLLVQRSGTQLNQAKASALAAAYVEVMRNMEIAKINVQKETPLFGIIDEPDLPLMPARVNVKRYSIVLATLAFFLTGLILSTIKFYQLITKSDNEK